MSSMTPHGQTAAAQPLAAATRECSIFAQASRIFDGWTDPETGLCVLRVATRETLAEAGCHTTGTARTPYHQCPPFFDGGRRVLLRITGEQQGRPKWARPFLDLTTGELHFPTPDAYTCLELHDAAGTAVYARQDEEFRSLALWDLRADRVLATYTPEPGWKLQEAHLTADGRHVLCTYFQGIFPHTSVDSRLFLLADDGAVRELQSTQGYFLNHIQGCPSDPNIYAYDLWPTPKRHTDVVIHIAALDGTFDTPLPQLEGAVRPGTLFGGQRDHYLWTPDGRRIVSYVSPLVNPTSSDHFDFGWWVSAEDWHTGEDLCVEYPPERWGCNFTISPDGRFIVTAGGRAFQHVYLIDIEGLRAGWNERVLCRYPFSEEDGRNRGPFHMPWPLPDQSGVLFSAGWPNPETDGVYLVEWPQGI